MEREDVEGMAFPILVAETLAGARFQTPDPEREITHVILIAFKRSVQPQIDQWLTALADPLEQRSTVEMYEIPMLAGRWRLMSGIIDGGMRSGIPAEQHSSVATFYGDVNRYKDILDMDEDNVCYLYVIAPQGTIRFAASGPPTAELIDGAIKALE
ncbi:MAG: hypothetical protein ACOCXF_00895 [bacterium]